MASMQCYHVLLCYYNRFNHAVINKSIIIAILWSCSS